MLTSYLAAALTIVNCVTAAAVTNAKLEIIRRPPPNVKVWVQSGAALDDHPVVFKLNLAGERFGDLHQKMVDISSTRGQWLTSEELSHYVKPSIEARRAVDDFLARHNIAEEAITLNGPGSIVTVRSDVGTVSRVSSIQSWLQCD